MTVNDTPGVLAEVARVLADNDISIGSMVQEPGGQGIASLIFMTHLALERDVNNAIAKIQAMPFMRSSVTRLRVETL
jgi:homoserine dehydrogenase